MHDFHTRTEDNKGYARGMSENTLEEPLNQYFLLEVINRIWQIRHFSKQMRHFLTEVELRIFFGPSKNFLSLTSVKKRRIRFKK